MEQKFEGLVYHCDYAYTYIKPTYTVFILHKSTVKATVNPLRPMGGLGEEAGEGVLAKSWGVNHPQGCRKLPGTSPAKSRQKIHEDEQG